MKAPLPIVTPETEAFWRGGEQNELRIMRCDACAHYIHPPVPICPKCRCREVRPHAVSGRAFLASYTVNYQPWVPGLEVPFVVGLVELVEQRGLRLTTNIVNMPLNRLEIGMRLRVTFLHKEDVWLPLFEGDDAA